MAEGRLQCVLQLSLLLMRRVVDGMVACVHSPAQTVFPLLHRLSQAWRSFLQARSSGGAPSMAAQPDAQADPKAAVSRTVLAPVAVVLPALAMHASGAGVGMSLAATGLSLLALTYAPLPRQVGSGAEASRAPLADADRRALEEAAGAPLAWWPGLPGWGAAALLLATCWHAIDVFRTPL